MLQVAFPPNKVNVTFTSQNVVPKEQSGTKTFKWLY
jgi:hypothetical protein